MVFDPIDLLSTPPDRGPTAQETAVDARQVGLLATSTMVESLYIQLLCPSVLPGVRGLTGNPEAEEEIDCVLLVLDAGTWPEPLVARCAEIRARRDVRIICIYEGDLAEAVRWVQDLDVFLYLKAGTPVRVIAAAVTLASYANEYASLVSLSERKSVSTSETIRDLAVSTLTARQIDVLRLLAQGYSNKAIAHSLLVSEPTVKVHLASLRRIFRASNRTEVLVKAARLGLLPFLELAER